MCMAGLVTAETPWETFGRELTEPYGYAPGMTLRWMTFDVDKGPSFEAWSDSEIRSRT